MEHSLEETSARPMGLPQHQYISQVMLEAKMGYSGLDHDTLREAPQQCSPNLIWREKVAQWAYDVVDHLDESRSLVYVTMNILDRYSVLHFSAKTTERDYETAALTALFMAIRISGQSTLEAPDLTRMSRLGIKLGEIIQVGKSMTETLSWDQRLVSPVELVKALRSLLDTSVNDSIKDSLLSTASFLCEASVCDSFFAGVDPLKIAVTTLLGAIGTNRVTGLSCHQRQAFFSQVSSLTEIDINSEDIVLLKDRLFQLYQQSEESSYSGPHVIPDTEEDEQVRSFVPRPFARVVSSGDLVSMQSISCTVDTAPRTSAETRRDKVKRAISPSPEALLQITTKRARTTV